MTTAKIAVTIPEEVLRDARAAVRRGRARSLSAYTSEALRQKTMLDDLDALLEQMLEESGGSLSDAEKRRADAALFGAGKRARKR